MKNFINVRGQLVPTQLNLFDNLIINSHEKKKKQKAFIQKRETQIIRKIHGK